MSKSSTPTLTPHQTLASRVSFMMTPSKSFTMPMAAVPWWTEHSPNSVTSGWKLRSQDIDSLWKNVMTSHYTTTTLTGRISPTTTLSFEQADSWLTPEGLHALGLPSSPSSSQKEPLPLPYCMKMDSLSSVYPRLTTQGFATKSPSVATVKPGGTMKRRAPTASAT